MNTLIFSLLFGHEALGYALWMHIIQSQIVGGPESNKQRQEHRPKETLLAGEEAAVLVANSAYPWLRLIKNYLYYNQTERTHNEPEYEDTL